MAQIERNEQRRRAFEQARIVQRTGVDGAHAGNQGGKLRDGGLGFRAIAADQGVAIERMIELRERFRAQRMKRRDHGHAGHKARCLLRGRAIPQA